MNGKGVLRISHESQDELERKLVTIMERYGYRVERPAQQVTVKELCALVGRSVGSVSRSLHRPSCPDFDCVRGKRRIIRLTPNPRLLAYLRE